MVEFDNLTKWFGDKCAVDSLNLRIDRGELFAILGPNAAGKTTTIKILTGLMKPTSGSVSLAGYDVQAASVESRKRLAYVPDYPFLYDKLTSAEFLRFIADLFRIPGEQAKGRAERLVARFNLGPYLDQPIEGLSHGTRQRVAIASAFLHDPEVFVIDEPMVGLDPHHGRVFKDMLKERSRAGMTVFLSTHQLGVAEELADRIGIMHHGRLIAAGSPESLRAQSGAEGMLEKAFLALTEEGSEVPGAGVAV